MPVECGIGHDGSMTTETICGKRIERMTFFTFSDTLANNPPGVLTLTLTGATGQDFSFIRIGARTFNISDATFIQQSGTYNWSNIPFLNLSSSAQIVYSC